MLAIISTLGIDTTAIAAALDAVGLGVGLALQGALSNLAGGVLIILFRPFKIGDLIEAQAEIGVVKTFHFLRLKL